MDTEGLRIETGTDGGGWRQFLRSVALPCGSCIDLRLGGGGVWITGHYEMDFHARVGFFVVGETMMEINQTMKFRWTPRGGWTEID